MRNSNNKPRCEKLSLSKCPGVCRTYSDLQLTYAKLLQDDDNIAEFRCNVPLENFELTDGAYTTDFVCTTITGEVIVWECIKKTLIERPKTIKMLDASREYWAQRGVMDWGVGHRCLNTVKINSCGTMTALSACSPLIPTCSPSIA